MTRPTVGKHGVRHGYVALAEGAHGRCVWVGAGLGCVTFENVSVEAVNRCAFLLLCFFARYFFMLSGRHDQIFTAAAEDTETSRRKVADVGRFARGLVHVLRQTSMS